MALFNSQQYILSKQKLSSFKNLRNGIFLLLTAYFVVGIGSGLKLKQEIFPLFSWFLFSSIPNQSSEFNLLIHEYNGIKLNPPQSFHKAPKSMVSSGKIAATVVIDNLGRNYVKGNQQEVLKLRHLLENNFFNGSIQYELIHESYEPLEKWKTGQVKTKSLRFFRTGDLK